MNVFKKTDFNFNYISTTAYRALLLLKFLMVKSLTRAEIIKCLENDEFIVQRINSDTIRSMLNSLKDVGCDISRPTKTNGFKYEFFY